MKKIFILIIILITTAILISCSDNNNPSIPQNERLEESQLYEDIINEDLLYEDNEIEKILYEVYLEEKFFVEDVIKESLVEEDQIKEVLMLETFYIPADDPYKYYDGAAGAAVFGDNLDIHSLITKSAVGAGAILTIAAVSVTPYAKPISVAVITLAKNALPTAVQYAKVGTILGAGIGATFGITDALDSSQRITALTGFGLATSAVITSIIFPPLAGTAFATWGAVTAITASSLGLVYAGHNAYEVFMRTDGIDIDLANLNWDQMGYTIAERAIGGAVDGFVVGAISGAVLGATKSFHKVEGKTVLIDSSTFDPNFIDDLGRTNIQRMQSGLAPIGYDGKSVNLHHLDQTDNGVIVEMMQTTHRSNHSRIHNNIGQYPSVIDRPAFSKWKALYWVQRATQFI